MSRKVDKRLATRVASKKRSAGTCSVEKDQTGPQAGSESVAEVTAASKTQKVKVRLIVDSSDEEHDTDIEEKASETEIEV